MWRKTSVSDGEWFDRACETSDAQLTKQDVTPATLELALRLQLTVATRRLGKARMAPLLREICADLDLVAAAPAASSVKPAARFSAKMFRAACFISMRPSLLAMRKSLHERVRRCVPNIWLFHP